MRVLGIAALLIASAVPLQADEAATSQRSARLAASVRDWLAQPALSGEWAGGRPWLSDRGVSIAAAYVTDILGDPVGGMRHKVRYYHDIFAQLTVDLDKLASLPGAQLVASMSSRAGTSLSDEDIGNVFNVAQVCCQPQTRLVTLAWQQTLFARRLSFRIGHLCTGDDFVASPLYELFVTSGVNANPGALALNVPFFEYPDASLGAVIDVLPIDNLSLQAGVYDGSADSVGQHGVSFNDDFDTGALVLVEAAYQAPLPFGGGALAGNYKLGGYYHTGRFRRFDAPPGSDLPHDNEHGNGGYYLLADQRIYAESGSDQQGLTPFVALLFAASEEINEFPFFFDAGLVYQGLLPRRGDDYALFGIVYGSFSSDLRAAQRGSPNGQQDFEMVLEWSYIVALGPWLQLQPDIQYVIKPGGTGKIPDALVVGAQISVTF